MVNIIHWPLGMLAAKPGEFLCRTTEKMHTLPFKMSFRETSFVFWKQITPKYFKV